MSLIGSRYIIFDGKGEFDLQFRHEVKHEITYADMLILRQRLRAVMKSDPHAVDGKYEIRSLYFDTLDDKALSEKLDGVKTREKYRIRLYNRDTSVIFLERKFKCGGLGNKASAMLTKQQASAISQGDASLIAESTDEVILNFYSKMCGEGLVPRVIVDYTREPFVFSAGNVRVTLDYNIRTALRCTDFLNFDCVTVPVPDSPCILEVKWDDFLPDIVRDAVCLENRHSTAYSKYAACRMYD